MAAILALALLSAVVLVGVAIIMGVAQSHNPTPALGENTTQVLTAIIGGLVGMLGAYIGNRTRDGS